MYYSDFDYLDGLKIEYQGTKEKHAVIYGDGRDMVEVIVKVKIMNSALPSTPVEMTKDEMRNSIFLCDYQTGEKIPFDFESEIKSDWRVSFNKNNYLGALEYSSSRADADPDLLPEDGYNYCSLYVYCTEGNLNKKIAAGIDIPEVGVFNTTSGGTNTVNGSTGVPFKAPGELELKAIDFGYLAGLKIEYPGTARESAVIYGNGLNMIEVRVKVKIMNCRDPSTPVEMTKDEMEKNIFLCDYQTGERIPFDFEYGGTSDWRVSFNKNNYLGALEYSSSRADADPDLFPEDGYNYCSLYVYCTKGNLNKKIAAGIVVPDVGVFKTTSGGTNTNNGSGGAPFKAPDDIEIRAIEPHKYTRDDFSMNTDTSYIPPTWSQGAQLYSLTGTNYYLDIQKPFHKISSVKTSVKSGSRFGSDYSWYWIWQAFDCAADYGNSHLPMTFTVNFGKYEFLCEHTINKQPGVCFTLISGHCSVMTSWAFFSETYIDIIDNFGNRTSPVISFHDKGIEHSGFRNNSRDISESTVRDVSNYGVPEDIIQHITDSAPDMICGVLSQDGNNSGFRPCVNASPAPEQGAIMDADFLRTLRQSHEITHVICSVPDALSHDVSDYQAMSDRDGLPYLLVLWPGLRSLTIFPQTEPDYENRPYIYGQYDCYSLIRDYLLREKGIALNDYPREVYFLGSGNNIFEVQAPEEGFVKIEDTSLQAGDILVFNLPSTRLQHSAVYIGNGQMLHHLPPGLSCREAYSEKWEKRTSSVWRHNNLIIK